MFSISNSDYSHTGIPFMANFSNGQSMLLLSNFNNFDNYNYISLIRKSAMGNTVSETNFKTNNNINVGYNPIFDACFSSDESVIIGTFGNGINLTKISSIDIIEWGKTIEIQDFTNMYTVPKIANGDNGECFIMISDFEFLGVIKIDANGNILWSKKITGIISGGKSPGFSIVKNINGGVLCTLKDDSYQSVISLDSNGDLLWGKSFMDLNYRWPIKITTNASGEIIVAGSLNNSTIYFNKFSPQGDILFAKYLDNVDVITFIDLKQNSLNNDFTLILSEGFNPKPTIVQFDNNGNYLWNESFDDIQYVSFSNSNNNLNSSGLSSNYNPVTIAYNGNLGVNCNTFSNPDYNFINDTAFISSIITDGANINSLNVIGTNSYFTSNNEQVYTESDFCEYFGINEIDQKNDFTIYPNPTSSNFTIESDYFNSEQSIEIHDNVGRVLLTLENLNQSIQINASSFKSGIYFVVLKNNNEALSSKRLVIN